MTFIDTNVFVYSVDVRDARKQSVARATLARAFGEGDTRISLQVLNEFANVALKKLHLEESEISEFLELFEVMQVIPAQLGWTRRALNVKKMYDLQFYDALMIVAAEAGGCDTILTEDLNDGQVYCGVRAVNPFKQKE